MKFLNKLPRKEMQSFDSNKNLRPNENNKIILEKHKSLADNRCLSYE